MLPIYVGDDRTDEDAFKVLREGNQGFGILVSSVPKETNAFYSLRDPSELLLLKSTDGADVEWCKEVKGSMYDMVVEGFQLLSRWTARIWEQCAWKFSRPCKDTVPTESNETSASFYDYEKVVIYNYSLEERRALVELVCYIKSIGSLMLKYDTLVADAMGNSPC